MDVAEERGASEARRKLAVALLQHSVAPIRAMHEPDLARTRAVLVDYLCEWMGGERRYSARHGPPALRRRHMPFAIDDHARDAWMACMRQALAETCPDAALRGELASAFFKIAHHLRNTETHDPPVIHRSPS